MTQCFAFFSPLATVRYRLTVTVEVNGAPVKASSIVEVAYLRGRSETGSPYIAGHTTGVSPVVDLEEKGLLLVALRGYSGGSKWLEMEPRQPPRPRPRGFKRDCVRTPADLLEKAFGLDRFGSSFDRGRDGAQFISELRKLRGRKVLDDEVAFIWFPANGAYDQGHFMCPEKLTGVIGGSVDLIEVVLEIEPKATLEEKLKIEAPWLDQIRISRHPGGQSSRRDVYVPDRNQFETSYSR